MSKKPVDTTILDYFKDKLKTIFASIIHTHSYNDLTNTPVTVTDGVIRFSNGVTITCNNETGEIKFTCD